MADELKQTVEGLEKRVEELDKRVGAIETTKNVLAAVAVIYGLSASWGAIAFNKIHSTVDAAQQEVARLQAQEKEAERSVAELKAAAAMQGQVSAQVAATPPRNPTIPTVLRQQNGHPANSPLQTTPKEPPFETAVEHFRNTPPVGIYTWDTYKNDLRNLAELLLGYLGYIQSNGGRADVAESDKFFDQLRLAAEDVKQRAQQKLPQDDENREWHAVTSPNNFIGIVNKLKGEIDSSPNNSLPFARITYYETDVPHWRDGILGVPIG